MGMVKNVGIDFINNHFGDKFLFDGGDIVSICRDGSVEKIDDWFYGIVFNDLPRQVKVIGEAQRITDYLRLYGDYYMEKVKWTLDFFTGNTIAAIYTERNRIITLDGDYAIGAIMVAQELGVAECTPEALFL